MWPAVRSVGSTRVQPSTRIEGACLNKESLCYTNRSACSMILRWVLTSIGVKREAFLRGVVSLTTGPFCCLGGEIPLSSRLRTTHPFDICVMVIKK